MDDFRRGQPLDQLCTLPLHRHFQISASARLSLSIYNTQTDIDKLIATIHTAIKTLKQ